MRERINALTNRFLRRHTSTMKRDPFEFSDDGWIGFANAVAYCEATYHARKAAPDKEEVLARTKSVGRAARQLLALLMPHHDLPADPNKAAAAISAAERINFLFVERKREEPELSGTEDEDELWGLWREAWSDADNALYGVWGRLPGTLDYLASISDKAAAHVSSLGTLPPGQDGAHWDALLRDVQQVLREQQPPLPDTYISGDGGRDSLAAEIAVELATMLPDEIQTLKPLPSLSGFIGRVVQLSARRRQRNASVSESPGAK